MLRAISRATTRRTRTPSIHSRVTTSISHHKISICSSGRTVLRTLDSANTQANISRMVSVLCSRKTLWTAGGIPMHRDRTIAPDVAIRRTIVRRSNLVLTGNVVRSAPVKVSIRKISAVKLPSMASGHRARRGTTRPIRRRRCVPRIRMTDAEMIIDPDMIARRASRIRSRLTTAGVDLMRTATTTTIGNRASSRINAAIKVREPITVVLEIRALQAGSGRQTITTIVIRGPSIGSRTARPIRATASPHLRETRDLNATVRHRMTQGHLTRRRSNIPRAASSRLPRASPKSIGSRQAMSVTRPTRRSHQRPPFPLLRLRETRSPMKRSSTRTPGSINSVCLRRSSKV